MGLGGLRQYAGLVLYEPKGGIWVSEKNEYPSCDMNSLLHAHKKVSIFHPLLSIFLPQIKISLVAKQQ